MGMVFELVLASIRQHYSFTVFLKCVNVIVVTSWEKKNNDQHAYTIKDFLSIRPTPPPSSSTPSPAWPACSAAIVHADF